MSGSSNYRQKLFYILSILITLVFIPVILILLIPLLIYRYLVAIAWVLINRFEGTIVSPESSTYAVDNFLVKPTCSLVISIEFENSDSSPSDLTSKGIAKLKKLIDSGNYPELQSYLVTWMGFSFWKRDYNFNIDDHIHFIDHPMSQGQLDDLKRDLLQKPFERKKPLWDFTRVIKTPDYKTVLLLRIHHAVADGYSVIKLTSQLRDSPEPWTQRSSNYTQRTTLQSICFSLRIIFCGPIDLVYSLLTDRVRNAWRLSKYSETLNCVESQQIPLGVFKNIARSHDVTLTSVLFAGLTGAVRNMMLKYEGGRLPDSITVICPFPLPGHPDNLSNHMTMVPVKVPMGQGNPLLRLKEIQKELHQLKNSTLPFIFSIAIKLIGSLPSCLIKSQSKGGIGTAVLSNFPGPDGPVEICGHVISEIKVMSGIAHGIMGVNCGVISYNGSLTISLGIDESIFSDPIIVTEFLATLLEEFRVLSDSSSNSSDDKDKQFLNLRKIQDV